MRLGRPQSLSGHYGEDKNFLQPGFKTHVICSTVCSVYLLHCAGLIRPCRLWGYELVSQNLHEGSKENHTEPQSCLPVFRLRFDSRPTYATGSTGTHWPQNAVCNSYLCGLLWINSAIGWVYLTELNLGKCSAGQ